MRLGVVTVVMAIGIAPAAMAQEAAATAAQREKVLTEKMMLSVQTRITAGAPYSADAVTETTQALPDGNRIARKNVTRTYRDGEGRTRREDLDPDSGALRSVTISDPIAGTTYTLDPVKREAYQAGVLMATPQGTINAVAGVRMAEKVAHEGAMTELRRTPPPPPPAPAAGGGGMLQRVVSDAVGSGKVTRIDLPPQAIEGVQATGTRTTTVIPAGEIGNVQPITIVSEQWLATDLKVLVLTKHSDPRAGDTVYRLTNIVRAEPDRSLFMVPADYAVKEQLIRRMQP